MHHYFGAHYDSNNLIESAERIKKAGGNLIQIFLTLPGNDKIKERSEKELEEFKNFLIENKMKVVVHSAYIHNVARNWDEYSWWIKNLQTEIKYCHGIGAIGLVLHFGKQLDLSIEEAYNNMYTSLLYIHNKTINYKDIQIIMETSSGQGSELCYKIEDLAYFFKKFTKNENKDIKNRFRICIDSCHIFAAGYDIRKKNDIKRYLETFEELIGLRYVGLIHLNDSKVSLGEQKDRHNNIGKGYIGSNGLIQFYKYFKKINVPIVLETPEFGYKMEIHMLLNS
jgi:deoxyribonuclease-4